MSRLLDAEVLAARTLGQVVRRAGRGGGTSLPGRALIRLDPRAIAKLAGRLPHGSAVISATNGKTTTAAMAAAILDGAGERLVHNRAGANMAGGVASALLAAARPGGIDGGLGLFELDELWLDRVVPQLRPRALSLGNLFRDQLDRYGELETIADRWAAMVAGLAADVRVACNADDPLIADLGRRHPGTCWFGVEDPAMAATDMQHASDSKHCRNCGAAYEYDAVYLGHLGVYHCPACWQRRPEPEVAARAVELLGTRGARFELHSPAGVAAVELPLPGLYNVYNALAAAALCLSLGVELDAVVRGLSAVSAAFGRAQRVTIGARELSILLVKNPAGANEVARTLALEDGELDLLAVLNDNTADGRDISWIWDADLELLADRVRRITCAGTRAAELALRFKYAGVSPTRLHVVPELPAALDAAVASRPEQAERAQPLFVLPTYTALLELQRELARRGHVDQYWSRAPSAVSA
ncbi:MAG: MurT ligase domain-containing protein [Solirubrobacteraceae bacterium]